MENKISLRNAKVMYNNGNIIPVELEDNFKSIKFISTGLSSKVMFLDKDADLNEKAAKYAICLKTYNKDYVISEIGSLIECMRYYGIYSDSNNQYIKGIKNVVKSAKNGNLLNVEKIMAYYDSVQITEKEFVELTKEIQKTYQCLKELSK